MKDSKAVETTGSETDASTATHVVLRAIEGYPVQVGDLIDCTDWKKGHVEIYVERRRLRALPPAPLEEEARLDALRVERRRARIDREEAEAKAEAEAIETRQAEIRRRLLELERFRQEASALEAEQQRITLRSASLRNLVEEQLPRRRALLVPLEQRAAATTRAASARAAAS